MRLSVLAAAGLLLVLRVGLSEAAWYSSCPACARHLGGSGIAGPYPDQATCESYRAKMRAQNFPFGPCYSDGASAPSPGAPSTPPGSNQPVYTPPPSPAPSRPPVATTPGSAGSGDCQDSCLAACPKRSGPFGSAEIDRACAQRCLSLECPVAPQRPATAPPSDAPIELALSGVTPRRALSRGPLVLTAMASPPGGSFAWRLNDTRTATLENQRGSQGIFPMPQKGPMNAQASEQTVIPFRPGRVEISVEYSLNGKKVSRSAMVDFLPPLLFLHGIASNAYIWNTMTARLEGLGLVSGGVLCGSCPPAHAGDFYTANFAHPQASYVRQGPEVAGWVNDIVARVPSMAERDGKRVVVVAHSMGGLAARAYLQGDGYRGNVAALVTVGTPHSGSIAAQFLAADPACKPIIRAGVKLFGSDLDLNSEGTRELAMVTDDMKRLKQNAAILRTLGVQFVFVVGSMGRDGVKELQQMLSQQNALARATFEACDAWARRSGNTVWQYLGTVLARTDGLVDVGSQNLNTLVHGLGRKIDAPAAIHCCWTASPTRLTEETRQTDVILNALRTTGLFEGLSGVR